ncbi:DEAD/DEAH box helicase family protein [Candidatus Stoquefichus massiliensis]|nr:DEAD/DEAH box helicase family protein [Candidatus Stoquefichus massiliensis]
MDENVIYNIIENHSNNDERLFLLDAPTGFGKTYNVIKYIQNHYKDKKIF